MKNLIKSLALVAALTVVGSAHSSERVGNGTFTANASGFIYGSGFIDQGTGRVESLG